MSAEPSSKRAKIEDKEDIQAEQQSKEDIQAEQQSFNIVVWMRDSGRFHYFMVEASDTIEGVRAKIQDKEGIPLDQYTLFETYACDMVLEDSKTISYYGFQEGDCLCMKKMFRLFVSGLGGKTTTVDVAASDCIEGLKNRIQDKTGVPKTQQRLIFGLVALEGYREYRRLSEYNIQTGDELTLVLSSPSQPNGFERFSCDPGLN
jgi:hypothetical protein